MIPQIIKLILISVLIINCLLTSSNVSANANEDMHPIRNTLIVDGAVSILATGSHSTNNVSRPENWAHKPSKIGFPFPLTDWRKLDSNYVDIDKKYAYNYSSHSTPYAVITPRGIFNSVKNWFSGNNNSNSNSSENKFLTEAEYYTKYGKNNNVLINSAIEKNQSDNIILNPIATANLKQLIKDAIRNPIASEQLIRQQTQSILTPITSNDTIDNRQ
jgi:hypothetical protein